MLQCTPAAAATLEQVREQNSIPENFGVRLFAAQSPEGGVGLGIGFAEQPTEGDEVTQQHGSTLYVAPEVSDELSDVTLDVRPDPSSNGEAAPQLVLRPTSEI
jgi:Fe-S cluster assembly iron-binding protein IscA